MTVPEPSVEETIEILRGLRDRFEAHHKVKITEEAIAAAAKLSDRYITQRFMPDKAIDLIDQAAARVRIRASSRPKALHDIEEAIRRLRQEQDAASAAKQYDKAKELEARIKAEREAPGQRHGKVEEAARHQLRGGDGAGRGRDRRVADRHSGGRADHRGP